MSLDIVRDEGIICAPLHKLPQQSDYNARWGGEGTDTAHRPTAHRLTAHRLTLSPPNDTVHSSVCVQSQSGSEYTLSQLNASAAQKESYFAARQAENATRQVGLHPSQGGKYVGFGSAPTAPAPKAGGNSDASDLTALFSSGWSRFTSVAQQVRCPD